LVLEVVDILLFALRDLVNNIEGLYSEIRETYLHFS